MQITGILALDKKRSRIWLDEEFAFVLYKGELRRFRMEEGGRLSDSDYSEIMNEILPKRAKMRAMNLLMSRTYSESGLRAKLKEGFYPESVIDEAISYVKSFGYINDERIAEEYIRTHMEDKSKQRIFQDLFKKGVSADVIERAYQNCKEDGFIQDETRMAIELLKKKGYDFSVKYERNEYARFYSFLMRKGFNSETVRKALGNQFDEY